MNDRFIKIWNESYSTPPYPICNAHTHSSPAQTDELTKKYI